MFLKQKLFLDTTIEEESDVSIFLCFSNMSLGKTLLGEPFCKHVCHGLWQEGDREWELGIVS